MVDIIQLRGHHLATFAFNFWRDESRLGQKLEKLLLHNELLPTTYHRKDEALCTQTDSYLNRGFNLDNRTSNVTQSRIGRIYGEEMKNAVDTIYSKLKDLPDTLVMIVEGYDSICNSLGFESCPKHRKSCRFSYGGSGDGLTLKAYGLEVGKTYTAREIVQRVIQFTQRTGFLSPRQMDPRI